MGAGTGFAAGCFGAAALSARAILFAAGGFNPVSGSLRFAPTVRVFDNVEGATRWDARRGSSRSTGGTKERTEGAGSRIEGRLSSAEVVGDKMFGDFSARGILLGEAILDG